MNVQKVDFVAAQDERVERLWDELEDVPVNPVTECIEQSFYIWDAGTDRSDIWHWFDQRYSKGISALLYPNEEVQ